MIIALLVTIASTALLVRALMILMGIYKTPILQTFEEYGPEEKPYLPGLPVMLWAGIAIFSTSLWVGGLAGLTFSLNCLGIGLLILTGVAFNYWEETAKFHLKILPFPRWYHELESRTTRYERRRIAYMWLHLPLRVRLTYNSSDKLFQIWADFVIMGTIREEEIKPGDEELLYTQH